MSSGTIPSRADARDSLRVLLQTDNQGHPVESNFNSETVGSRGPMLLEDYHVLEKLAQFHRFDPPLLNRGRPQSYAILDTRT